MTLPPSINYPSNNTPYMYLCMYVSMYLCIYVSMYLYMYGVLLDG